MLKTKVALLYVKEITQKSFEPLHENCQDSGENIFRVSPTSWVEVVVSQAYAQSRIIMICLKI